MISNVKGELDAVLSLSAVAAVAPARVAIFKDRHDTARYGIIVVA